MSPAALTILRRTNVGVARPHIQSEVGAVSFEVVHGGVAVNERIGFESIEVVHGGAAVSERVGLLSVEVVR